MRRYTLFFTLIASLLNGISAQTEKILLRFQPDTASPILTEVIATENVLLEAAPVDHAKDWQQLTLKVKARGYLPTEALSKSFEVITRTPVFSGPSEATTLITTLQPQDTHVLSDFEEDWTRVEFEATINGYFNIEETAPQDFATEQMPAHTLGSALDATDVSVAPRFDPSTGIQSLALEAIPAADIEWKAGQRSPALIRGPGPQAAEEQYGVPALPDGMVATQSKENRQTFTPGQEIDHDKTPRLLSGTLVREINNLGPVYPIRLRSPEGQLIAYVDLSEIFVPDFSPYLEKKVYVRGPVYLLEKNGSQLVIVAQSIKLTE